MDGPRARPDRAAGLTGEGDKPKAAGKADPAAGKADGRQGAGAPTRRHRLRPGADTDAVQQPDPSQPSSPAAPGNGDEPADYRYMVVPLRT